jgi:hypothetical protein
MACDIPASTASAYGLSTSKITLSDINKDLPAMESLLEHKRRLRKPWKVTHQKNDPQKGTRKVGNEIREL